MFSQGTQLSCEGHRCWMLALTYESFAHSFCEHPPPTDSQRGETMEMGALHDLGGGGQLGGITAVDYALRAMAEVGGGGPPLMVPRNDLGVWACWVCLEEVQGLGVVLVDPFQGPRMGQAFIVRRVECPQKRRILMLCYIRIHSRSSSSPRKLRSSYSYCIALLLKKQQMQRRLLLSRSGVDLIWTHGF
jgi:hypothetical protein